MSTPWHIEYLSALAARDKLEHTSKEVYDAFAKLAEKKVSKTLSEAKEEPVSLAPTTRASPWSRSGTPTAPAVSGKWQEELQEAQKRRAELESSLAIITTELEQARTKLKDDERRTGQLASENMSLTVKLRDRVEELRAKAKHIQDVHDEAVALNLQLNISEENNAKLKKENKDLVDRWMARMGKEADAMNEASKFS